MATILVCLLALARLLPADRLVAMVSAQVERLGLWGAVLFGLAYVVAALIFVPGSALTLAAGAVFGLWWGTLIVSIAATCAAALAFLIGRYLARDAVRAWAARRPKFRAIDAAIGQGGWKVIALLRLSPVVPFSLGNYLFGLTAIGFLPYVLTSWIAMLPGTFLYVYLGYAGRAGLAASAGAAGGKSPGEWTLLVVGLLATLAVIFQVTRIARRAIQEHTDMDGSTRGAAPASSKGAKGAGSGRLVTGLTIVLAVVLAGCTGYAYAHRPQIASLFGPPAVTLVEAYAESPAGARFDHSAFEALLKRHVDARGLVDYVALATDAAALDAYIRSLAAAPIDELGRNQRLALLINAYNAFTLRMILDYPSVKSIKDISAAKRWEDRRWNVAGQVWSLEQIENEQIRPHFKEPRIHFALVCAALGCPPLRNEAYDADRLEDQLQAQALYVHGHDTWFQYDPSAKALRLTRLYDWYGGDFEQVAGSIVEFAARYSPVLKAALAAGDKPDVEFLDYDWSLNARAHKP